MDARPEATDTARARRIGRPSQPRNDDQHLLIPVAIDVVRSPASEWQALHPLHPLRSRDLSRMTGGVGGESDKYGAD